MYISRVEIDIENRKKIRDLTHLGAYHNWVEQCFPNEIDKKERTRKLWRIDKVYGKNYLLIISQEKPNIECLEKYGVKGSGQSKFYDNYLDNLKNGVSMKFRVTLNPTITLSKGTGNKGEVKPHITITHQLKYLMDRSVKNGFVLNDNEYSIVERGYEVFRKSNQKSIRFIKVVYEGILTINDIEIFKKTLIKGFGKHKAYGFGMMTIMPIND